MKKVLFLLIICIIKLNAWQLITRDYQSSTQTSFQYYYDNTSSQIKFMSFYNGNLSLSGNSPNDTYFWTGLSTVRQYNGQQQYKTITYINNRFKEEPIILSDFYNLGTQLILNYFYNPNNFNRNNYIQYDNYNILYDKNGLAVESCVEGVYAGLYNMDEMQFSGNLYNENGDLVLVNGVEPSYLQMLCDKLIGDLHLKMLDAENLIDKGWIFAVAFTLAMFYLISRTLKRVLIGKKQ